MLKTLLFLSLTGLTSLVAQTESVTSSLVPVGDGSARFILRNNSAVAVTAYVVTWTYNISEASGKSHRRASRVLRDFVTRNTQPAIAPNGEVSIPVGLAGASNPVVKLQAGIFADGATFGDPQWVALLRQHRADYVQATDTALQELKDAIAQNIPTDRLVLQLQASLQQQRAQALEAMRADIQAAGNTDQLYDESTQAIKDANLKMIADEEKRACIQQVYRLVITNLTKLPKSSDGTQLTATNAMDQLVTTLTQNRASEIRYTPQQ